MEEYLVKVCFKNQAKRDIITISKNLADYVVENKIKHVILLDCSARPAHIGLKRVLREEHPNTPIPNIYFTNPHNYYHWGFNKPREDITQLFDQTYPLLAKEKNSKILIFDVCMHSARVMTGVFKSLKHAGYTNLSAGLAQPRIQDTDRSLNLALDYNIDFTAVDKTTAYACYTFGIDHATVRTGKTLFNKKDTKHLNRLKAKTLRREIHKIFDEHYKKVDIPEYHRQPTATNQ